MSPAQDIPAPAGRRDPSRAEILDWLNELNRLRDAPGEKEEVRTRLLEHIELAEVALGWTEEDE